MHFVTWWWRLLYCYPQRKMCYRLRSLQNQSHSLWKINHTEKCWIIKVLIWIHEVPQIRFVPKSCCSSEFILVLCLRWSVVLIKPLWVGFKKKQPFRYVLRKRCSENMQQIYRSKPKPKCDFNKVSLQLYWTHASAWVFSLFSEHLFLEHLWTASSDLYELDGVTFLK